MKMVDFIISVAVFITRESDLVLVTSIVSCMTKVYIEHLVQHYSRSVISC